jgi:hypothetical protein
MDRVHTHRAIETDLAQAAFLGTLTSTSRNPPLTCAGTFRPIAYGRGRSSDRRFPVKIFSLAALLAGLFCFSGAPAHSPGANREADESASAKEELLAVHQAGRRAHFNRDVDSIIAGMGPEFTTVHDGKIRVMSREDVRKQFTEYFHGAEFSAWDDLEPPVIRISPDGKMGWMIARVRIAYTKKDAAGARSKEDTVMAWMSAYEKRDGKWLLVGNATTSEP